MCNPGYARLACGGVAAVLVASCSPSNDTGVLGNGQFRYLCGGGEVDEGCGGSLGSTDVSLPGGIAVGATFQIGYAPNSANGDTLVQGETGYEIVPASPELASATGDTILALRSGYVALLARHVGNAQVDDFVHLKFAVIQTLKPNATSLDVSAGKTIAIELHAFDPIGAPLAGRIACQWRVSSGAASVAIDATPTGATATVRGLTGGSGTVHATCGDASVDVPVTVTGTTPIGDGGIDG
jgi:hypothetical protein